MWILALVLCFSGMALCRPAIETAFGNFSTEPLSLDDYAWLAKHVRQQRVRYPAGFQFMYVAQGGQIVEAQRPGTGDYIEVIGSPRTSRTQLYTAAMEVFKMMRHSPAHVFNNIARKPGAGLGVFTAQERLTIFPEFYDLRDTPACRGRCDGECRRTCLFDGRKIETLAGISSTRSAVLIDNFMCTAQDPYRHHDNILVHEFAHCVEKFGLNSAEQAQVITAYNNAQTRGLWAPNSYAMANHAEYFAEGTGAFFLVNLQSTTGGMTICPGSHQCRSETEVRRFLQSHDYLLFTALSHTYTDNRNLTPSGLRICDASG